MKRMKLKRLLFPPFRRNEKLRSIQIMLANKFLKEWSIFNKQIGETHMIIVQAPELTSTMPDFIRKPKRNPNNKFPEELKDLIDKQCGTD
jgi:hypothetical protein